MEIVLRVASATVGASEVPPNTNRGPYVERLLAGTQTPKGSPWCAAWLYDVGRGALGTRWPAPKTASVADVVAWADASGRSVADAQRGDVFALYFPALKRHAHTGLIESVNADGTVNTIEANTSGSGSREGWLVARKTRALTLSALKTSDRVIRWSEAL